jgi:HEAT repeat protein
MTAADEISGPLAAITRIRLARTGGPAELSALIDWLGHDRKVVQRAAAEACTALAVAGLPVVERLRTALAAPRLRQRWGAAYALALLGPPPVDSLPVLLDVLAEPDGDLRWAAAEIVVRMAGQVGVEQALHTLLGGASTVGRKMALYCLRDLHATSPETERAAIAALGDADIGVRLAALAAVAALVSDRTAAGTRVATLLDDEDAGVRRAAAATLVRLAPHGPAVRAALERAAATSDTALRRAAQRALRRD